MTRTSTITAVAVATFALLAATAAAEQTRRTATEYAFDGFQLGANLQQAVMSKGAFAHPCDDDPIENNKRTIVVYMGQECRGHTFPESTTVLFYLPRAEGDARLSQPIQAMAWMGGGYFNSRSDFPAQVGQRPPQVDRALGRPTSTFRLGGRRRFVTVREHPGDVFSVVYENRVVAFAVGQMPDDHEAESWGSLLEMIGESMGR